MIYVSDDELLKEVGGIYKLTRLVFQRAKELNKEARKLGKSQPSDSISIALEDFKQGKLKQSKEEKESEESGKKKDE